MKNIENILIPIIERAGEIILSAQSIESGNGVKEKAGDAANMVTLYDVSVQNFLISEIQKAIPEACFIAEEKENDKEALRGKYCFIIDPIDGTANFIHEYNHSCISLAMFSGGEAVFSAVYDPYLKEMFSAIKGGGAFLNGKKMTVSSRDMAHSILAFGSAPYFKDTLGAKTFKLAEKLYRQCSDVRRCGSAALDLAYLAAGRNDMFFELALYPWDVAAAHLLIKEAGGIITDAEGKEIDFSERCPVIAANKVLYQTLLEEVKNI